MRTAVIDSPVGPLSLSVEEGAIVALAFEDGGGTEDLEEFTAPIRRYFDGDLHALEALPVAPAGTPFQRAVWAALREIPVGTTATYADIARRVGRPKAVRAVGAANGQNPVGIVIPCHRVIGSDGSLTGYGGGLPRKGWLLRHEGALLPL